MSKTFFAIILFAIILFFHIIYNGDFMKEVVNQTIKNYKMFNNNDSVVVGLSGGADSVALLYVLLEIAIKNIFAVHINHNLRGEEANKDENFTKELCEQLGITLKIFSEDVKGLAKKENIGIEEAGRNIRYARMEEARIFFNATKIATGHHGDDVTETVLMNLCRGSGLKGLCGIPPIHKNIVRPLIEVSRKEIEEYLHEHKIPYITDSSNFSLDYTRNRIRQNIIPIIEKNVNSNASKNITRNVMLMRQEDEFLDKLALETIKDCGSLESKIFVIPKLLNLPDVLLRRVIRLIIADINKKATTSLSEGSVAGLCPAERRGLGGRAPIEISMVHIEAVIRLLFSKTGKEVHLPSLIVYKVNDSILFSPASHKSTYKLPQKNIQGKYCYKISINEWVYIKEIGKTVLFSSNEPLNTPNPQTPNIYCTNAFNYDKVGGYIYFRTRRPGDKIIFGGTFPFTKKIKDYFIDIKLPHTERDIVPLCAVDCEILWILDKHNRTNVNYQPHSSRQCWISLWR